MSSLAGVCTEVDGGRCGTNGLGAGCPWLWLGGGTIHQWWSRGADTRGGVRVLAGVLINTRAAALVGYRGWRGGKTKRGAPRGDGGGAGRQSGEHRCPVIGIWLVLKQLLFTGASYRHWSSITTEDEPGEVSKKGISMCHCLATWETTLIHILPTTRMEINANQYLYKLIFRSSSELQSDRNTLY